MRREDARAGVAGQRPSVDMGEHPEAVGVEDGRLWQVTPEVRHDLNDRVGAAEPGADGHGVCPLCRGLDLLEGGRGERAFDPPRQAVGHHTGVEAGGDRGDVLGHEGLDKPHAAPQRRHGGERRCSGHTSGPPHDDDSSVVVFARVAAAAGQPRQVVWWHRREFLGFPVA